jgi:hypothetical protein
VIGWCENIGIIDNLKIPPVDVDPWKANTLLTWREMYELLFNSINDKDFRPLTL